MVIIYWTFEILKAIFTKGFWTQYLAATVTFLCFYYILKSRKYKKFEFLDYYALLIWFYGFFFWFINGTNLLVHYFLHQRGILPPNQFIVPFLTTGGIFLWIHTYFFIPFLLAEFTNNRTTNYILSIPTIVLWFTILYLYIKNVTVISGTTSYAFQNPTLMPIGYILGGLAVFYIALSLTALVINFRKGKFSLGNLGWFYRVYAIILYAGVSIINVLLISTRGFTYLFFPLIAYLTYLGYKDYFKGQTA